jgi:hypothetical protein
MTEQKHDFGKRRPLPPPATPPVKRSGHVALLLTGTLVVGGSAFALMPQTSPCEPTSPGMAAPALPPADGACPPRGSSSGGGGGGSGHGFRFFSGDSDSRGSSTQVSDASASHVTRGGFGSFAHAFGFSRGG